MLFSLPIVLWQDVMKWKYVSNMFIRRMWSLRTRTCNVISLDTLLCVESLAWLSMLWLVSDIRKWLPLASFTKVGAGWFFRMSSGNEEVETCCWLINTWEIWKQTQERQRAGERKRWEQNNKDKTCMKVSAQLGSVPLPVSPFIWNCPSSRGALGLCPGIGGDSSDDALVTFSQKQHI